MSYPKPLSEKNLEKMYTQAALSDSKRVFLNRYFDACTNLYGAISIRDAWKIYLKLENVPRLHRKEFIAFSAIARREVHSYYIFEIDELFSEEERKELDRFIVSRELVSYGYGKFYSFYKMMDQLGDKPYCVPNDFLSFSEEVWSDEEEALRSFLCGLKATADECVPKYGASIPNDHKGKRLDEFSFLNSVERSEINWLKQRAAKEAFLESISGTEAEKIMKQFKRRENIGSLSPVLRLQFLIEELEEVGVQLGKSQLEKLLNLVMNCHNHSRQWCLSGWSPAELASVYRGKAPTAISFGPNMQKAFADGSMDKDEIVRELKKMGVEVIN